MALSRRIHARRLADTAARERAGAVTGGVFYAVAAIAESSIVFVAARSASGTKEAITMQPKYIFTLLLFLLVWAGLFAWGAFTGRRLAKVIERDYLPLVGNSTE